MLRRSHSTKAYIDASNIYTTENYMMIDVMDEKDIPNAKEMLISHARHEAETLIKEGQRIIDGLKRLQQEGKASDRALGRLKGGKDGKKASKTRRTHEG